MPQYEGGWFGFQYAEVGIRFRLCKDSARNVEVIPSQHNSKTVSISMKLYAKLFMFMIRIEKISEKF